MRAWPRTERGRRTRLACTLLLLAACAAPAGTSAPAPLRVLTYNIRYGSADDGADRWELRRDFAIDIIRTERPHVMGLQEALRFQLDEIARELPRYAEIGVGRDDGGRQGEYVPILFDSTTLQRVDAGWFWFSDSPEVPGSTGWGNTIPRIATWARLRERESGLTFLVYNVHFDHASQPSRERSAALLLDRIARRRAPGEPVIVTGDFNAGEANRAFAALLGDSLRLRDTFRALHPDADSVGTFHAFRGGSAGEKIDAVLAGPGWQVDSARIVRTQRGGRYPSDHYPVLAVIRRSR